MKTYAQLKGSDKMLDIPEIQELIDLDQKNELKKHLDEAVQRDAKNATK